MSDSTAQLYQAILKDISTAPLSALLPSVLRLARELKDDDLAKWVRLEFEGYFKGNSALTEDVVVPEYREVVGQYSDELGNVLLITDPQLQFTNEYRVRWGAAELERFAKEKGMITIREVYVAQLIKQHFGVDVTRFSFNAASLDHVLSGIRATLVERLHNVHDRLPSRSFIEKNESNRASRSKLLSVIRDQTLQQVASVIAALLVAFLVYLLGWG